MSQHDYAIANSDGATVRADINNALSAIVGLNSGATAPTTTFAYMYWADTTNNVLKQRNSANSAWKIVGSLDTDMIISQSSAYTVLLEDYGKIINCNTNGGAFSLTLPAVANATEGFRFTVRNEGTGVNFLTLDPDGTETIDGSTTVTLYSNTVVDVVCDGSGWVTTLDRTGFYPITKQTAFAGTETELELLPTAYGDIPDNARYRVEMMFKPNGDAAPWLRVQESSSYVSGASDYTWLLFSTADTTARTADQTDAQIELRNGNIGGAVGDLYSFATLEFYDLYTASRPSRVEYFLHYISTSNTPQTGRGYGYRNANVQAENVKIFFDAGETFQAGGFYQVFRQDPF